MLCIKFDISRRRVFVRMADVKYFICVKYEMMCVVFGGMCVYEEMKDVLLIKCD